ncbi:MAG: hypothetical protein ACK5P5_06960 [Pseudobdellovibrionaceae bacterium]
MNDEKSKTSIVWQHIDQDLNQALNDWHALEEKLQGKQSPDDIKFLEIKKLIRQIQEQMKDL